MKRHLLFLTLNTFSATGGIEKVCRMACKAIREIAQESNDCLTVFSMYDEQAQVMEQYLPTACFKGFSGNRMEFVKQAISKGRRTEVVILSHINLLTVGYAIKLLSPKTKLYLIAHGVEVWSPLPFWKVTMLKKCNAVLPVSRFTKEKMQALFHLKNEKLKVINNCLDPFLERTLSSDYQSKLKEKYHFRKEDFVLMTLTRLKSSERYKGYDKVIMALPTIIKEYPTIKYLIIGKYDDKEKARLDHLIREMKLENYVVFTGFVPDEEIESYFTLSDVYIMPSTGEGFGIVFIEALFYCKPVIAGNVDGSVDALAGGEFGILVNPNNIQDISNAIRRVAKNISAYIPDERNVRERFAFHRYKEAWRDLLYESCNLLKPNTRNQLVQV